MKFLLIFFILGLSFVINAYVPRNSYNYSIKQSENYSNIFTESESKEWKNVIVIEVHDGDTFTCIVDQNKIKVRIAYIDAPETNQKFGNESTEFAKGLLLGGSVSILEKGKDRYGRSICIVNFDIDGKKYDFSLTMISRGMAWFYPIGIKDQNWDSYRIAEYEAQKERKGLWSLNEKQIRPSEWRQKKNLIIKDSGKSLEEDIKIMNPDLNIILQVSPKKK